MSYYDSRVDIDVLVGKTLKDVKVTEDEIEFVTEDGETYLMYHEQDCCENVSIDDVNGDIQDLIGSPITLASERTSTDKQAWEKELNKDDEDYRYYDDSFTWTFYTLATVKGYVDIRWYGSSNGYYSESVSLIKK